MIELLTALLFAWLAYEFVASRPKNPRWEMLIVGAVLTGAFIVIVFIDVDFRIIPNEIDVPGMIIAPFASLFIPALHATAMPYLEELFRANWPGGTESLFGTTMPVLGTPLFENVAALIHSIIGLLVGAGIIWSLGVLGGAAFRKTLEADEKREMEKLGISEEAIAGEGEEKPSPAMGFGDVKLMGMLGGFFGVIGVFVILVVGVFLGAVIGGSIRLFYRKGDAKVPFGPFLCVGAFAYLIAGDRILKFIWTDIWVFMRDNRAASAFLSLTACALCLLLLFALRRRRQRQ
jgi:leader peptidase (prepilin peptidase)/N-methyltransferase